LGEKENALSIRSIALSNFQSHDSTLLEFDPKVNVIVGDSDSGKTSILRALSWVLTNRPTGEAFRRYGSSITKVAIVLDDGTITRSRSDRENLYYGAHSEKLAAIGTSVPESVSKLLKMDPELNIQRQLDAPFLLSCSPGEVAQRLNASVGLDEIDIGLANAARQVRLNQSVFSDADSQCRDLSEQIELFAYLVDMEQVIRLVENEYEKLLALEIKEASLRMRVQEADESILRLTELPDTDGLLPRISVAEKQISVREKRLVMAQGLFAIISEIASTTERLDRLPDVKVLLDMCKETTSFIERLSEQRLVYSQLQTIIEEATRGEYSLQTATKLLRENEERFHKDMPATCPLCNQRVKKT
jgi:energy-coupling factor transporter ATP-binding protein EcfA2